MKNWIQAYFLLTFSEQATTCGILEKVFFPVVFFCFLFFFKFVQMYFSTIFRFPTAEIPRHRGMWVQTTTEDCQSTLVCGGQAGVRALRQCVSVPVRTLCSLKCEWTLKTLKTEDVSAGSDNGFLKVTAQN